MTIAQQLKVTEFPFIIKDSNGNTIYCEHNNRDWYKCEYDAKGEEIYFEDSSGVGQFNGIERRYCSTFGCRNVLTITEAMAGTKCLHCQGNKDTVFKHYKL